MNKKLSQTDTCTIDIIKYFIIKMKNVQSEKKVNNLGVLVFIFNLSGNNFMKIYDNRI